MPRLAMLCELMAGNKATVHAMREDHKSCCDNMGIATASLREDDIDEADRRTWFLYEASRSGDGSGH